MDKILLGTGVLNWDRTERITDRYGAVHLSNQPEGGKQLKFLMNLEGQKVALIAVVKETRESPHIGDFFRGLYPETPYVGENILLGTGTLFFDEASVGLKPDDGRDSDWLNPKALYRLHYQTVELYAEPL